AGRHALQPVRHLIGVALRGQELLIRYVQFLLRHLLLLRSSAHQRVRTLQPEGLCLLPEVPHREAGLAVEPCVRLRGGGRSVVALLLEVARRKVLAGALHRQPGRLLTDTSGSQRVLYRLRVAGALQLRQHGRLGELLLSCRLRLGYRLAIATEGVLRCRVAADALHLLRVLLVEQCLRRRDDILCEWVIIITHGLPEVLGIKAACDTLTLPYGAVYVACRAL